MPRFTHLHVASELSVGYATGRPEDLVTAAVHDGAEVAAITDRDGLYGAIRHIRACRSAGIDAVVGVDLALPAGFAPLPDFEPLPGFVDARITVLAHGHNDGAGWAALCRFISAAHRPGAWAKLSPGRLGNPRSWPTDFLIDDGAPVATVLLGPDSDVGRAVATARADVAAALLAGWKRLLPGAVVVEVVCHFAEPADPASLRHATRMLQLADAAGVPAVLSNATRYVRSGEGLDPDTLDGEASGNAASLRPLGAFRRQQDGQAWFKPAEQMVKLAQTIAQHSSLPHGTAGRLLAETERLADRCRLHPETDLGWGTPKSPDTSALGVTGDPLLELRRRSERALLDRYSHTRPSEFEALQTRLGQELDAIGGSAASYLLTVAEVSRLMRDLDVRNQVRGPAVDSLLNYLLRISDIDPVRHGLLLETPSARQPSTMPHIDIDVQSDRRHDVCRAILDRLGAERTSLVAIRNGDQELGVAHDSGDVILGGDSLLRTTPVQLGQLGLPMSQFDRDDMRDLGLLTIGLHAAPIQSSLAYTVAEIRRVHGPRAAVAGGLSPDAPYVEQNGSILLDGVPLDDQQTLEAIRTRRTVGIFQLESPRQRELIEKTQPTAFDDLVADISRLSSGPVEDRLRRAHAVALALPTFQSAWLKTHYPAEFLAAILTHDSSVYPNRLLLEEARRMRIPLLPLDVSTSRDGYRVERIDPPRPHGVLPDPDEVIVGIRLSLSDVHGITADELDRILIGQPYASIADFYQRATPSRGLLTNLGLVGALDSLVFPAQTVPTDLPRPDAADSRRSEVMARVRELLVLRKRPKAGNAAIAQPTLSIFAHDHTERLDDAAAPIAQPSADARPDIPKTAEVSDHVIESYRPLLDELGVVPASELVSRVTGSEVLIAGIRVPSRARPIRGGKGVVSISLDDGSGCADATFFEEAQAQAGPLLFGTRLMIIQGTIRHVDDEAGDDAISLEAVNAWDLKALWARWQQTGGERQAS
jgi:DNA polymerase III alpha subunit